jgi:hypothetical protein
MAVKSRMGRAMTGGKRSATAVEDWTGVSGTERWGLAVQALRGSDRCCGVRSGSLGLVRFCVVIFGAT